MPKAPEHQPGSRRGSELPAPSRPQGKGLAATPPPPLSPAGEAERTGPGPEPFVGGERKTVASRTSSSRKDQTRGSPQPACVTPTYPLMGH